MCVTTLQAYNSFGGGDPDSMDNVKFAKLARDAGLTAGVVTKSDIDVRALRPCVVYARVREFPLSDFPCGCGTRQVIFTKVKEVGERRIGMDGFEKALLYVGTCAVCACDSALRLRHRPSRQVFLVIPTPKAPRTLSPPQLYPPPQPSRCSPC